MENPQNLGDFRPISLVGCMYKIMVKLLAKGLKIVLSGVIDQRQSEFLGNRYLFHSVLVENKVIDKAKREKKKFLVFKVDYEKTYDSIDWNFILYMLRRLGFCNKWVGWIQSCLVFCSTLVLVNSSPKKEFMAKKGISQGDTLAPFLITIVGEGLCGMMRQALNKNLYSSFLVGKEKVKVNPL